ncbi:hypothetical protein ACFOWE_17955 [Planomonospora corallina]|uniref:Uncharacterized protein n=1 Tax=Planomonospora corallina TaxID=1806052 RepID=A0ABV8ICG0_9ACTN
MSDLLLIRPEYTELRNQADRLIDAKVPGALIDEYVTDCIALPGADTTDPAWQLRITQLANDLLSADPAEWAAYAGLTE